MVLFIGYHATTRANRTRIQREGLRPGPGYLTRGVFVFSADLWNDAIDCEWASGGNQDVWQVAYCGQMYPDLFARNSVILPAVQDVTLVTGNE